MISWEKINKNYTRNLYPSDMGRNYFKPRKKNQRHLRHYVCTCPSSPDHFILDLHIYVPKTIFTYYPAAYEYIIS